MRVIKNNNSWISTVLVMSGLASPIFLADTTGGPVALASRTPGQCCAGCGVFQRKAPTEAWAQGMPSQESLLLFYWPRS